MQTTDTPLVFALVLNYCSAEDSIECYRSVINSRYARLRVLVIDNGSPDGSSKYLHTYVAKSDLVHLAENTGYAEGNNIGIRMAIAAGADYIFILNPDVRLNANTIEACVRAAEADPAIGAVNPIQLGTDSTHIDKKFLNAVLKPAGFSNPVYRETDFPRIVEVTTLFGAALLLPARTIKKAGGFDPLYFAYGEEEDLCRRIRRKNLKLAVTTNAPVIHKRTTESHGVSDFVLFLRLKGAYLYNLKNPNLGFRYALKRGCQDIALDLMGKRSNTYPFNAYPITFRHIVRTIIWLTLNAIKIRHHRKLDDAGAPYI